MKRIVLFTLFSLMLSGCSNLSNKSHGNKYMIMIKSLDVVDKWDRVPVTLKISPAMKAGDLLILKHRENEIIRAKVKGKVRIEEVSLYIRALGTGNIVAFIHHQDGDQSVWARNIMVNKIGAIPKYNNKSLSFVHRVRNGGASLIINNDSAVYEFIKKVTFEFDNGEMIICGSRFLSANPYIHVKPVRLVGKPKFKIKLAKNRKDKCDM